MFRNTNNSEGFINDINLQLRRFVGRKLIQVKFKESGNSFLLVFSDTKGEGSLSIIQLFNCFLFNDDGVFAHTITEVYFKSLAILTLEYCNRHGINTEPLLELKLITKEGDNSNSQDINMLLVGCERIAITENINSTAHFWEI